MRRGVSGWDITVRTIKCGESGRVGGEIGSGLYALDLRETSPISSPGGFVSSLHKYAKSLALPLLTFSVFAFAASVPLLRA